MLKQNKFCYLFCVDIDLDTRAGSLQESLELHSSAKEEDRLNQISKWHARVTQVPRISTNIKANFVDTVCRISRIVKLCGETYVYVQGPLPKGREAMQVNRELSSIGALGDI